MIFCSQLQSITIPNMKSPSLAAIIKFKQEQENKKLQERERIQAQKQKLYETRAAQGDRKAKSQLKLLEKKTKDREEALRYQRPSCSKEPQLKNPPKKEKKNLDFSELMKLAQNNAKQPSKIECNQQAQRSMENKKREEMISEHYRHKKRSAEAGNRHIPMVKPKLPASLPRTNMPPQSAKPSAFQARKEYTSQKIFTKPVTNYNYIPKNSIRKPLHYDDEDEDEYEEDDEYDEEMDDFIVDDEEDEAKAELDKTLKHMFRYDKRKSDLREMECDREYRQIGRVANFEDLEREERRASRLAAIEDARALKEEEDRKRAKLLRKQKR